MSYNDRLLEMFKEMVNRMSISSDGKKTMKKEIDQILEEGKIASAAIETITQKFNEDDFKEFKKIISLICYRMKDNEKNILNENEEKKLIKILLKYLPEETAIRFAKKLPYLHVFTVCYMNETLQFIEEKKKEKNKEENIKVNEKKEKISLLN